MTDGVMERKNRVFIGGISDRIQKEDIEREFGRFGKLNNVWVAQNPPGFAFVEYDHISEADLAVAEMNGKSFLNSLNKIRVEHSHGGGSRNRQRRGPSGSMNRGPPGGDYMSGGGRPIRDRYGSNNFDGGYSGGGGGGYGRGNSDYYGSSNGGYGGGGRRDYGGGGGGGGRYPEDGRRDRTYNYTQSSNGRYSGGGGGGGGARYRSDSSERPYGGGGGYGSGGARNRSRSPPSVGRRQFY